MTSFKDTERAGTLPGEKVSLPFTIDLLSSDRKCDRARNILHSTNSTNTSVLNLYHALTRNMVEQRDASDQRLKFEDHWEKNKIMANKY